MEEIKIQRKWNWSATLAVVIIHAASVYAITYGVMNGFSSGSWMLFGIFIVATVIGVSIGYHRLVTHGSFECIWPIKLLFLMCAGLAVQGSAIKWASNHRTHHLYADREGDLHSPLKEGFWHAHAEWFMVKYTKPDENTICSDLLKDKFIVLQKYWVHLSGIAGFVIPFIFFGLEGMLLAGVLRLLFASHAIFAINSVCHKWGERPYATKDVSTNNIILGWLIPSGEPFHNNHHADPKCAYMGWHWYQPDMGKWILQLLSLVRIWNIRLVWNIRKPRLDRIDMLHNRRISSEASLS